MNFNYTRTQITQLRAGTNIRLTTARHTAVAVFFKVFIISVT